jgi:hypothetical protein
MSSRTPVRVKDFVEQMFALGDGVGYGAFAKQMFVTRSGRGGEVGNGRDPER